MGLPFTMDTVRGFFLMKWLGESVVVISLHESWGVLLGHKKGLIPPTSHNEVGYVAGVTTPSRICSAGPATIAGWISGIRELPNNSVKFPGQ